MTSVSLRPNESQEQLFKRFKKKVMRSGLLSQLRNKRWFVSKSEVRRIEKKKAIRRINKRKRRDSERRRWDAAHQMVCILRRCQRDSLPVSQRRIHPDAW